MSAWPFMSKILGFNIDLTLSSLKVEMASMEDPYWLCFFWIAVSQVDLELYANIL